MSCSSLQVFCVGCQGHATPRHGSMRDELTCHPALHAVLVRTYVYTHVCAHSCTHTCRVGSACTSGWRAVSQRWHGRQIHTCAHAHTHARMHMHVRAHASGRARNHAGLRGTHERDEARTQPHATRACPVMHVHTHTRACTQQRSGTWVRRARAVSTMVRRQSLESKTDLCLTKCECMFPKCASVRA